MFRMSYDRSKLQSAVMYPNLEGLFQEKIDEKWSTDAPAVFYHSGQIVDIIHNWSSKISFIPKVISCLIIELVSIKKPVFDVDYIHLFISQDKKNIIFSMR